METENKTINISTNIQDKYDKQYSDEMTKWRKLGAKGKANNIISLCYGKSFNKVAEIGAGNGAVLQNLDEKNFSKELNAIEISDSAIEQINKRKFSSLNKVIKYDGSTIPLKNNELELAICTHVIEHVEHPRILLREIKRISEYQLFEVPIDFSFSVDKKVKHFLSYGHINIYTPALFKFLLLSEGFEILKEKVGLIDTPTNKFILNKKKQELSFLKYLVFYFKNKTIRVIWKILPKKVKEIKPQTFTVLAKKTNKALEIF